MFSVKDFAVAALVVIVMGETAAQAFPMYEPVARDVIEFGPSNPISAKEQTQLWKQLFYPMFDSRLRRTDQGESSYESHSNDIYKLPPSFASPAGTPPPPSKKNENKDQHPTRRQQHEAHVGGFTDPDLFFKVYL